jgi:adenine-specific DNA-methyltransferase
LVPLVAAVSTAGHCVVTTAAWSALYSTKSYPFDRPAGGKIAVKVINHYGDEVLKVYAV